MKLYVADILYEDRVVVMASISTVSIEEALEKAWRDLLNDRTSDRYTEWVRNENDKIETLV